MHIKTTNTEIADVKSATVAMDSGDHLSVNYTMPNGKVHTISLSARHMVFLATHENTDASIIVRPAGVTTVG